MYSNVVESLKSRGILPKQRSTQPRTRDQANHFYSVTTTHLFATSKTPFEAENEKYICGDAVHTKIHIILLGKVNSIQEACARCFAVHILKFEILQTT